jgi:pimeloyl-ACP methyl ester carboxylesterase
MQRREPLALLAASNVLHRYPVDASRVYVGGFSGGSRVAERLALAYPDLFHGALLNAGSDPIGTPEVPLPSSNLFERFQASSRLVYLTGKNDADHLDMDRRSRQAMNEWCVFDITPLVVPWSGHETPNAAAFSRGLNALEQHDPADPDKLGACRERYREELKNDIEHTRALVTQGDRTDAAVELQKIDARFGGLAAPFFDLAN